MAHPWAILMEKPVGLDLADAEDIAAAAKAAKAKVFVGLNRRTLSSTQAVLADLADDPGPRFIHVQDQQSLDVARQIGHAPEVVDNWMYANSIHLVDYIPALGRGKIIDVTPVVRWNAEGADRRRRQGRLRQRRRRASTRASGTARVRGRAP